MRQPGLESRRLYTGHRLAGKQVSARLFPDSASFSFTLRFATVVVINSVEILSSR
jgi:hypothetical protein